MDEQKNDLQKIEDYVKSNYPDYNVAFVPCFDQPGVIEFFALTSVIHDSDYISLYRVGRDGDSSANDVIAWIDECLSRKPSTK